MDVCFSLVLRGTLLLIALTGSMASARPWEPKVSRDPVQRLSPSISTANQKVQRVFQTRYEEALRLLSEGRYQAASRTLSEALVFAPTHAGARRARARALLTFGYLTWNEALVRRARHDIRLVLRWDPQDRPSQEIALLIDQLLGRMETITRPARPAPKKPRSGS